MARNLSGWIRQAPDPRDYRYRVPRHVLASLPDYFDLSAGMGPLLDQGDLGSCGPNTAAECIDFDQKLQGLPVDTPSRLGIYYTTRFLMGTVSQDSGVDNRSMLKALNGYGFASEKLWPYDTSKFTQKPPQAWIDAAAKNKIENYATVAIDLATMQGTLVSGHPFIFGFDVFNGMMSNATAKTGIVPEPSGSVIGGHDVAFVGFSKTDRPGVQPGKTWPANHFKFRNHWTNEDGSPWGDGGYGYMPFDYATGSHASDFWVINAVPGAVVPPNPGPNPPAPSPQPQPEPKPVNYVFQGTAKIPLLGNAPITGVMAPASSAVVPAPVKLTIPPVIEQLLEQYGAAVGKVLLADLPAVLWFKTKTWADVLKDMLAVVGLAA